MLTVKKYCAANVGFIRSFIVKMRDATNVRHDENVGESNFSRHFLCVRSDCSKVHKRE